MKQTTPTDAVAGIGFILLAVGLALLSVPVALIVCGGLLLAAGVWGSR